MVAIAGGSRDRRPAYEMEESTLRMRLTWIWLAAALLISSCATVPSTDDVQGSRLRPVPPGDYARIAYEDPAYLGHWTYSGHEQSPRYDRERDLARAYPSRIGRWGNLLILKLESGRVAWLADVQNGTGGGFGTRMLYSVADYWPDIGFYIVEVDHGEGVWITLVSERTARITDLVGYPTRAPGRPNLMAASTEGDMNGGAVELWRARGDHWITEFKCQLPYPAHFMRWAAPNKAVLRKPDGLGGFQEFDLLQTDLGWRTELCDDIKVPGSR